MKIEAHLQIQDFNFTTTDGFGYYLPIAAGNFILNGERINFLFDYQVSALDLYTINYKKTNLSDFEKEIIEHQIVPKIIKNKNIIKEIVELDMNDEIYWDWSSFLGEQA